MSAVQNPSTTPQSVSVVIYPAGTTLGGQSVDSSHSSQGVKWDETQYQLQSAILVLDASQSAELGADCWVGMNGKETNLALHWQINTTNKQTAQLDVTNLLNNGANDFWVHYDATQFPFTTTTLTFDLTLQVVLKYIGTGTPSADPITTTQSLSLPNLPWYYWVAIAAGVAVLIVMMVVVARRRKG